MTAGMRSLSTFRVTLGSVLEIGELPGGADWNTTLSDGSTHVWAR